MPPPRLSDLGDFTPTALPKLERTATPEKMEQSTSDKGLHTNNLNTALQKLLERSTCTSNASSNASSSCCSSNDPDIDVDLDQDGYPTIFDSILRSHVALDEDGYPTMFGSILKGDSMDSMEECDQCWPDIEPINPNIRSRKVQVNEVAKAKKAEAVANGVQPQIQKRLKRKQAVKQTTFKARMIQQMYPSDQPKEAAEASGHHTKKVQQKHQVDQKATKCKKCIKDANAVIMTAHGSCNAISGRFDIKGKVKLPDGTGKNIGILGFEEKASFGVEVWTALMAKVNEEKGQLTKGELLLLRDKLIASCKAGQPCNNLNAD